MYIQPFGILILKEQHFFVFIMPRRSGKHQVEIKRGRAELEKKLRYSKKLFKELAFF